MVFFKISTLPSNCKKQPKEKLPLSTRFFAVKQYLMPLVFN
ncbi:hypothetical protein D348_02533 [Enterococcus faecalis SLO2C-1]|nr:hypothetical protein D348_02533 [Enterococcus faecalis SLO2C-1]